MEELLSGYKRFRAHGWPEHRKLFESLAENGQRPKALVVACVDSRVDPSVIFDAGPGEMLTLRNVANLVPPYAPDATYHGTSAALEFAVKVLNVPSVVVLGHSLCGGIRALLEGGPHDPMDFIAPWMSIAEPACRRAKAYATDEQRQQSCEFEAIKTSLGNLISFPWIAERVAAGELGIHGAWFSIAEGRLMVLQPSGVFETADS